MSLKIKSINEKPPVVNLRGFKLKVEVKSTTKISRHWEESETKLGENNNEGKNNVLSANKQSNKLQF